MESVGDSKVHHSAASIHMLEIVLFNFVILFPNLMTQDLFRLSINSNLKHPCKPLLGLALINLFLSPRRVKHPFIIILDTCHEL